MSSLYCLWGVIPAIRGIVYIINQRKSIWNRLSWSVCWRVSLEAVMLITSWKGTAAGTHCKRYRARAVRGILLLMGYKRGCKGFGRVNFLMLCDHTCSHFLCAFKGRLLPPFSGEAPFDLHSSIVRGCGSCPCSLLAAAVLPFWQRWRPQRLWHQFLLTVQGGRPVFLCTF